MGMICELYAMDAADLPRLSEDPESLAELMSGGDPPAESLSLEKAWHGLHYLLTGSGEETAGPLAFLLGGGQEIEELDGGYGPPRFFDRDAVSQINAALNSLTEERLWSRYDPQAMTEHSVYPQIWDEPEADLRDEYLTYYRELQQFMASAARAGKGVLVTLV